MEKEILFRQIILVTDGESNIGGDPIQMATEISKDGINISTIGIIDKTSKEDSLLEVNKIADCGNGICEITEIFNLQQTMELVTQKSIHRTIETAVNNELKSILNKDMDDIHPTSRDRIIKLIDDFSDKMNLKCIVLLDCSKSMNNKIEIAKQSIVNLLNILSKREGKSKISVIGYPNGNVGYYNIISDFTEDFHELESKLKNVKVSGMTPTAKALEVAYTILTEKAEESNIESYIV